MHFVVDQKVVRLVIKEDRIAEEEAIVRRTQQKGSLFFYGTKCAVGTKRNVVSPHGFGRFHSRGDVRSRGVIGNRVMGRSRTRLAAEMDVRPSPPLSIKAPKYFWFRFAKSSQRHFCVLSSPSALPALQLTRATAHHRTNATFVDLST